MWAVDDNPIRVLSERQYEITQAFRSLLRAGSIAQSEHDSAFHRNQLFTRLLRTMFNASQSSKQSSTPDGEFFRTWFVPRRTARKCFIIRSVEHSPARLKWLWVDTKIDADVVVFCTSRDLPGAGGREHNVRDGCQYALIREHSSSVYDSTRLALDHREVDPRTYLMSMMPSVYFRRLPPSTNFEP